MKRGSETGIAVWLVRSLLEVQDIGYTLSVTRYDQTKVFFPLAEFCCIYNVEYVLGILTLTARAAVADKQFIGTKNVDDGRSTYRVF